MVQARASTGCSITGFVLVKKSPPTAFSPAMRKTATRLDVDKLNVTHQVHHFYFGQQLSASRQKYMAKFHRGEKEGDWHDKLANDFVVSKKSANVPRALLANGVNHHATHRPIRPTVQRVRVHSTHALGENTGRGDPTCEISFHAIPVQILGVEKSA